MQQPNNFIQGWGLLIFVFILFGAVAITSWKIRHIRSYKKIICRVLTKSDTIYNSEIKWHKDKKMGTYYSIRKHRHHPLTKRNREIVMEALEKNEIPEIKSSY